MKNKLIYEAPDAELILVRFEENILSNDASLNGRSMGGSGDAGYRGDSFDSPDNNYNL